MPLTVIFARHGESQANIDRVFANRPEIPGDLTPAGIAQAHVLAMMLEGLGVTHVYTSPLARARQTAEIVAATLDVSVTEAEGLREYDVGDFEGLPYSGDDHAWRWERYLEIQHAWLSGDPNARHEGGESLTDMLGRFLPFMANIAIRHCQEDVIVLIGHGGLYHHVLPRLFPNIDPRYASERPLGHGDIVVGHHNGESWRCSSWAGKHPTAK
jgi:broad specificity phosphatase PhoE